MSDPIIPEVNILRATISFLAGRGVFPVQISPPTGQGIDTSNFQQEMTEIFSKFGVQPNFVGNGPDIIGASETEYWQIECKGSGAGKPSTQRNNFDRALASVVSYYEDRSSTTNSNAVYFLGLALPKTPSYIKELKRRVRIPLRHRLNLWILLYDSASNLISSISPENEY